MFLSLQIVFKIIYFFRYLLSAETSKCRLWVANALGFFLGVVWVPIKGVFDLLSFLYQDMFVTELTKLGVNLAERSGEISDSFDLRRYNFIGHWFVALHAPAKKLGILLRLGLFPIVLLLECLGVRRITMERIATAIVQGVLAFVVSLVFYVPHKLLDELCTLWRGLSNAIDKRVVKYCAANPSHVSRLLNKKCREMIAKTVLENQEKINFISSICWV